MVNPYTPGNFSLDSSAAPTAPTQWNSEPSTSGPNPWVVGTALVAGVAVVGYIQHRRRKEEDEAEAVRRNQVLAEAQRLAESRAAQAFEAEAKRIKETAEMIALDAKRTKEIAEMEARAKELRKMLAELADLDHKMKVRARAFEMLDSGEVDPAKIR